jgi:glycosyltransferase involved in cell wall biosynthesis
MIDTITQPKLTICVIGRNEGANLADCAKSLFSLNLMGIELETIYIDSASSDESVPIARRYFDVVIELTASPHLNAGAARAVGTEQSHGDWVLYLDGDMRLSPDFVPIIQKCIDKCDEAVGVSGRTINIYPDGSSNFIEFYGNEGGQPCRAFGGAVMLNRNAVLSAGNWATNLYSSEEVELLSRLIKKKQKVVWTDTTMVEHVTEKFDNKGKLLSHLFPYRSFLGKKFYGAGQATRLSLSGGNLFTFARLKYHQYVMTTALVLSVFLLALNVSLAILPPVMALSYIMTVRGVKSSVNCICWASQVFFGWSKLEKNFSPQIRSVTRKVDKTHVDS